MAWLATVHLPSEAAARCGARHVLTAIQVEAVEADAIVTARAAADPITGALDAMVGIGPVLGLTIRAEIGDVTRFRRGAELASYAGLVPRVDASADRYWSGRITRDGSPWLRWALVEMARHAIKRPDAVGRWARRLAVRKGLNKARVALARVLCDQVVTTWPKTTVES